jgi:transcriptional regulator GlxA family with amidase domain
MVSGLTRRIATDIRRLAPNVFLRLPGWFSPCIFAAAASTVNNRSRHRNAAQKSRRVIVVVVPPVDELDLVGPLQVFSSVNRLAKRQIYSIEIVTNAKPLKVEGENGLLAFLAERRFPEVSGEFDSVLLVCGLATRNAHDPALFAWLKKTACSVRRLGAVCVGSFLLAEAGLLNGRKATTHWKFGLELKKRFPRVHVESDPLWVRDGNIYTCAGISAGIDLALAWAEEDCGSVIAHEAARELVLYLRRPGGQKQLSVSLSSQASEMKLLQELQVWIAENLRRKLSVPALADRLAMSVRNFERVFTRELGRTPAQYILQARVEAARQQLERSDRGLKEIAVNCGFGSADAMRRSFSRLVGITPAQYRRKIQK